jgi:hypothetical protein
MLVDAEVEVKAPTAGDPGHAALGAAVRHGEEARS